LVDQALEESSAQPAAEPYQLIVSSFSKVLDQAEALL
jgi:hypothetical protein